MNDEIKILEHLKDYLQMLLDSGTHKIFYNDLMFDEKTIDCINAITNLQQENEKLISENETIKNIKYTVDEVIYKTRIDKAIEHIEKHQFIFQSQYGDESNFDKHLLDILKGDDENENT